MEAQLSNVLIREINQWKEVKIGYGNKPDISDEVINKWQEILDLTAQIVNVPSALIMRLKPTQIEVLVKGDDEGNPYKVGEEAELKYGLYCETVIGTQNHLIVPDALESEVWSENNPDVSIDMISYMGVPLNWPSGEVFGTVCVLDNKKNDYSPLFLKYLYSVRDSLEKDLNLMLDQKKLQDVNKELIKSNEIKSKFLSVISHDIRASLGSIKEYTSFLINDFSSFSSEEFLHLLKSLGKSTEVTYDILVNLLLWSKHELLDLPIKKECINISELVFDVSDSFINSASLKQIKITTEKVATKVKVMADYTMLETAVRNIFSNAIKFSERNGEVDVRLFIKQMKVILEIEDNGIGMPKAIIESLFSYHEDKNRQGTQGEYSTGIGLMLLYEFINKNNGKIEVESSEGKGTLFRIIFDALSANK